MFRKFFFAALGAALFVGLGLAIPVVPVVNADETVVSSPTFGVSIAAAPGWRLVKQEDDAKKRRFRAMFAHDEREILARVLVTDAPGEGIPKWVLKVIPKILAACFKGVEFPVTPMSSVTRGIKIPKNSSHDLALALFRIEGRDETAAFVGREFVTHDGKEAVVGIDFCSYRGAEDIHAAASALAEAIHLR